MITIGIAPINQRRTRCIARTCAQHQRLNDAFALYLYIVCIMPTDYITQKYRNIIKFKLSQFLWHKFVGFLIQHNFHNVSKSNLSNANEDEMDWATNMHPYIWRWRIATIYIGMQYINYYTLSNEYVSLAGDFFFLLTKSLNLDCRRNYVTP